MKRCSACKNEMPIAEFNKRSDTRDGLHYLCRACQREVAHRSYERHKGRVNERSQIRRVVNRDAVTAARRRLHAEQRAADPEGFALRKREKWLATRYRLTLADYQAILDRQHGACAVCGTTTLAGDGKPFRVDHDHVTGRVRGILCHLCNVLLGAAHDDPQRLRAAIAYLKRAARQATLSGGARNPLD